MVNLFVLNISRIDDLTIQDLPIQVLTILCNTRLVLANQLSHSLMVDVSVYDLRDTRS
jgi:hypothetical protein